MTAMRLGNKSGKAVRTLTIRWIWRSGKCCFAALMNAMMLMLWSLLVGLCRWLTSQAVETPGTGWTLQEYPSSIHDHCFRMTLVLCSIHGVSPTQLNPG